MFNCLSVEEVPVVGGLVDGVKSDICRCRQKVKTARSKTDQGESAHFCETGFAISNN